MTKSEKKARPLPEIEVEPWSRFDWERLVRSADVLTSRQVQVAMVLASYADADGSRVRPGFELLADDCRCSVTTAQRTVWELLALGLLKRERRGGQGVGGGGSASEYRLTGPCADATWEALGIREPGKRRRLASLSGHEQPETLRSPVTGEDGPLRSPAPDSPVTTDGLSGHSYDQVPTDQPRPDQNRFSRQPGTSRAPWTAPVDEPAAEPADAAPPPARPRRPTAAELALLVAEKAIAGLTDAGRAAIRQRAIDHLERIGDLPAGWQRDRGQPWEPIIVEQMVVIMAGDQAYERKRAQRERRTGT